MLPCLKSAINGFARPRRFDRQRIVLFQKRVGRAITSKQIIAKSDLDLLSSPGMKSCCPHSSFARWTLLLLALTVSTATGFAQNVSGFIHGKIQNFQQTSSAAPVVNSAQPFQFGSLISMGTATINSATLTFTGTSSPRTYTDAGNGDFSILDTFTTQAQLDLRLSEQQQLHGRHQHQCGHLLPRGLSSFLVRLSDDTAAHSAGGQLAERRPNDRSHP